MTMGLHVNRTEQVPVNGSMIDPWITDLLII